MSRTLLYLLALLVVTCSCDREQKKVIGLAGEWNFRIDSMDQGIAEKWYTQVLPESISLPGSMDESGKGNDVSVNTKWTGAIKDSSWFVSEKYSRYRVEGNIKIPFWLQRVKHYTGAAWYQREIEIPDDWGGKYIELALERPHWESTVWIDNQKLGMQNSLATAHVYDVTAELKPGKHLLTLRVDNRIKEINPGINAHSISDHTQTNWNGIVGEITLKAKPLVNLQDVKIYPDVLNKEVKVLALVKNHSGVEQDCRIILNAEGRGDASGEKLPEISQKINVGNELAELELAYPMGEFPMLWDEFDPNLYTMDVKLKSEGGIDQEQVVFGMREFKADGTRFTINGRPLFLRGTLECAIFPKTAYPPTEKVEWIRILNVCKAHGLNHMRFHSWCPPKAAFEAADQLGIYLQVECSSWANWKPVSSVGDGLAVDEWLYREAEQILDAYGNHPSFCMMAYGNEPGGENQKEYLRKFVDHLRARDFRRVYTGGAGWPYMDNLDFYNHAGPRIQGWGQGLESIINKEPPQTRFDFRELIQKTPMPYVSHEIGQWCVYPNFNEIKKYTGVLRAKNFEIFQETLTENNLGHLAEQYLLASGKLQALCYKADIEAALRTPGFAGFQLLDLHDFPGQGTALVGILDPFWEEKGYISPEEFRRFCNVTVPLARMDKRVFNNNEEFIASIEVSHAGNSSIKHPEISWKIENTASVILASGKFDVDEISINNAQSVGKITVPLSETKIPQKLHLSVSVNEFQNGWDFWVYPSVQAEIEEQIHVTSELDPHTVNLLKQGESVLLSIRKNSLSPEFGGDIKVGFSSIFWNTAWTSGQPPHTLGILCDPEHPALSEFPTEYHSNWQWWDAMSHSNAIILHQFENEPQPIVRVIDDWFENRNLALVFEARVGKGNLIVSGIDLSTGLDSRPEARQLLHSLSKYMASESFAPDIEIGIEEIYRMFK